METIKTIDYEEEMGQDYVDYAMSVITERALRKSTEKQEIDRFLKSESMIIRKSVNEVVDIYSSVAELSFDWNYLSINLFGT